MIGDEADQRTTAWFRSRIGYLTGSKIADIMKAGRKKDDPWSETAKSYLYQVAAERLFNPLFLEDDELFQDYLDKTSFTSKAMEWGTEQESSAIELYEKMFLKDNDVVPMPSCRHKSIPHFAASPDGGIYEKGGLRIIEVKCPNINTYMKYRLLIHDAASLKETEPKYYWQMMAEMSCTEAKSGTFITYTPWLTKPIHHAEIERVEDDIKLMEERVILANEFIEQIINK